MSKLSFSKHVLYMAMIMALIASFSGLGPVSAQPTQALIEDWRASDFNYASSMMDTDQSDNVYVVGDTATSRNLIIKKFDGAGTLLWQTPYDAVDALSGVWIAVDGNGSAVVQANTSTVIPPIRISPRSSPPAVSALTSITTAWWTLLI